MRRRGGLAGTLALAACNAAASAPSATADVMLGRWEYATPATSGDGPSLHGGLQVALAIVAPGPFPVAAEFVRFASHKARAGGGLP